MSVSKDDEAIDGGGGDRASPVLSRGEDQRASSDWSSALEALSGPRSTWLPRVMQKHPGILEMRERIRPLSGAPSFGRALNASTTEVKEILSQQVVIDLISQFLEEEGLHDTKHTLEEECGIAGTTRARYADGALYTLLKVGVQDPTKLFDVAEDIDEEDDPEVQVFDGLSFPSEGNRGDDVDIWMERDANISKNDEAEVIAGTVNSLVYVLISPDYSDMEYRKIFLMTYRSFTTSDTLLRKLLQGYDVPDVLPRIGDLPVQEVTVSFSKSIHQRVFVVLKYWLEHHPGDWTPNLEAQLKTFIDNVLVPAEDTTLAKQLRNALARKGSHARGVVSSSISTTPPEPKVPKSIFSGTISLEDVDAEEIARQLTLLDYQLYSKIQPGELLGKAWCTPALSHRAPTVLSLLRRSDYVSSWVATTILMEPKLKDRARVMAKFIKIAGFLLELRNYHTLMALFAGLNNAAVYRLKFTRREVGKDQLKMLEKLEGILNHENAFSNYRQAVGKSGPPAIPFIALCLRDMAFVDESNDDIIANDEHGDAYVNFSKRHAMFLVMTAMMKFQHVPYNFHYVHQIASFLKDQPIIGSDEELYQKSLVIEPKNIDALL